MAGSTRIPRGGQRRAHNAGGRQPPPMALRGAQSCIVHLTLRPISCRSDEHRSALDWTVRQIVSGPQPFQGDKGMLKSDLIHRQTGSGYLTLKNGKSGQIAWNIEFRRKGINGHIFANDELIKLAAGDGEATLGLSLDEDLLVTVGSYSDGHAQISAERPVGHPIEQWQTGTGQYDGHSVVVLVIDNDLRYLSAAGARELARELVVRAETCEVGSNNPQSATELTCAPLFSFVRRASAG
jgi:hypothetical protein